MLCLCTQVNWTHICLIEPTYVEFLRLSKESSTGDWSIKLKNIFFRTKHTLSWGGFHPSDQDMYRSPIDDIIRWISRTQDPTVEIWLRSVGKSTILVYLKALTVRQTRLCTLPTFLTLNRNKRAREKEKRKRKKKSYLLSSIEEELVLRAFSFACDPQRLAL